MVDMKYCAYLFIVLFTLCSCGDEYLRKRVNTLEKEVDTLRNEIAIYKGMERDVRSRDLDDLVFYISSNPKYYHYYSDCAGLTVGSGKVESIRLEEAIDKGKVSCSICDENKQIYYGSKDESESVYICTGETSTKYHSDPDCRGLSRCSGEIEEVSEEEAEDMGRTPCKICH